MDKWWSLLVFLCLWRIHRVSGACTLSCSDSKFKVKYGNCWWWPSGLMPKAMGTYAQIETYCQGLNKDAHIMSITNDDELQMVSIQVATYFLVISNLVVYVGGMSDASTTWTWTDGSAWGYVPPNSKMNTPSSCAILWASAPFHLEGGGCAYGNGIGFCKMKAQSTCTTAKAGPTTPAPITTTTPMPTCPRTTSLYADYAKQAQTGYLAAEEFAWLYGMTLTECSIACTTQSTRCVSFDFSPPTGECRLMQTNTFILGCPQLFGDPDWVHYDLFYQS